MQTVALSRSAAQLSSTPTVGRQKSVVRREGFDLPAHASAVADAREKVCGQLRIWGLPEDLGHTAQLVISEFFTNAVVHTASCHVRCLLQINEHRLRIEVSDEGGACGDVTRREAAVEDVGGRGLQLVSAVAEQWGVRSESPESGRVVWAELDTSTP